MQLAKKAELCQQLREKIDLLLESESYDIELVVALNDQLGQLLVQALDPSEDVEQHALFLQQNLDWLKVSMAKLSKEKDAVAVSMLQIQKGRRAKHSYTQHN